MITSKEVTMKILDAWLTSRQASELEHSDLQTLIWDDLMQAFTQDEGLIDKYYEFVRIFTEGEIHSEYFKRGGGRSAVEAGIAGAQLFNLDVKEGRITPFFYYNKDGAVCIYYIELFNS